MVDTLNFREVKITSEEADQKDSGWHGPFCIEIDTAEWIQNALDERGMDLLVGVQDDAKDEVYVKVAPKPQEVDSSMLENIAYDEATEQLSVTFKNGSMYQYFDVEPSIANGLSEANSKGRYFIRHIRPWYQYKRVS